MNYCYYNKEKLQKQLVKDISLSKKEKEKERKKFLR